MSEFEILEVVEFAANAHKDQRRKNKDKTPYINHPIKVANNIRKIGGINNYNILAAGLLHDVVEDTPVTLDDIEDKFGKVIRDIVDEVSNDKSLSKREQKEMQVLSASHKSYGAKLVKLGDLLHNLSTLIDDVPPTWTIKRVQGYFIWKYFVMKGYVGTNDNLENEINKLFLSNFKKGDQYYPTLPSSNIEVLEAMLEEYYESL